MADLHGQALVTTLANSDRIAAGVPNQLGAKNIEYQALLTQIEGSIDVPTPDTSTTISPFPTDGVVNCAGNSIVYLPLTADSTIANITNVSPTGTMIVATGGFKLLFTLSLAVQTSVAGSSNYADPSIFVRKTTALNYAAIYLNSPMFKSGRQLDSLPSNTIDMGENVGETKSFTVTGTQDIAITNPTLGASFTLLLTGGTLATVSGQTPKGDSYDPSVTNIVTVHCYNDVTPKYLIVNTIE